MKSIFTLLLSAAVLICPNQLHAQTFSEWFHQDKTQKKYLLAQIAALQIYIEDAEKGYNIAKSGLTTIGNITNGEFGLHTLYFNSLQTVNPKIKNYSKVKGITGTEDAADLVRKKMVTQASSAPTKLSTEEMKELQQISNNIAGDDSKDLDELEELMTDGKLKMTDDERIKNIDLLYNAVREKYAAVQQLAASISSLAAGRQAQQKDAVILKQLYGGQ